MMHAPPVPETPKYEIIDHKVVQVNARRKLEGGGGMGSVPATDFSQTMTKLAEITAHLPDGMVGYSNLELKNNISGKFGTGNAKAGEAAQAAGKAADRKNPLGIEKNGLPVAELKTQQEEAAEKAQAVSRKQRIKKTVSRLKKYLESRKRESDRRQQKKKEERDKRDAYVKSEETDVYLMRSYNEHGEDRILGGK